MTTHDPRPPQWPPATATYEYLAAYERTAPTTPGADQQVWQLVRSWPGVVGGAIPVVTGR